MIKLIKGGVASDDRGCVKFINDFNFEGVKRFYQVQNHNKGFIRAWHGHRNESKYVYVAKGAIIIGAVKCINKDGTVDETATPAVFNLTEHNPNILFIPSGHANGFKTLTSDTIVIFFSNSSVEDSLNDDIRFSFDKWDIWGENYR